MLSEVDIIKGCRKYESTAQRILHNLYAKKMYAVCCRYISDKEEAKDVLQEGFIKVFQNFNKYKEEGPIAAWIRRIMVNTALSVLRKNKKQIFQSIDEDHNSEFITDDSHAEDVILQYHFSQEELLTLIDSLPEGLKLIFNLYAIEKYSHKEIAELLNIKEGTSRIRLLRARKELQEKVNKMIPNKKLVYSKE